MTDDQLPLPGQPESAQDLSGEPAGDDFPGEFDAPEAAPKKRSVFGLGKKKPMKTKKGKVGASAAEDDDLSAFDDGAFVEGEEEEFVEEDWEEFDDKFEGDAATTNKAAAAAKKAKSKNFNRIVIGGTAAIGLVIVFLNMSGGQSGPAAIPPPQQIATNGATGNPNANLSRRDIIYGHTNKNADDDVAATDVKGKSGVLNDPLLIKDIDAKTRATEFDDSYYYDQQAASGEDKDSGKGFGGATPHEVDDAAQPPMPETASNLPAPAPAPDTLTPMPQGQIPAAPAPAAAAPAAGVADAMNPPEKAPEKTPSKTADAKQPSGDFPTASSFAKAPEAALPGDKKIDEDSLPPQNNKIADAPTEENPFASTAPADVPANNNTVIDTDALPAAPVDSEPLAPQPVHAAAATATGGSDAKLDALLNRLDQIEAQISSVTARQDVQIQKMQQSISALQNKKASAPKTVSAPAPTDLTEDLPSVPRVVAASPRMQETPVTRPSSVAKPRTATATKAANTTSSSRGYVLKSAQPGRAMVAKGGETYTISVGENLPGLGKILQIYDRGGQWIVRGSSGTISQ